MEQGLTINSNLKYLVLIPFVLALEHLAKRAAARRGYDDWKRSLKRLRALCNAARQSRLAGMLKACLPKPKDKYTPWVSGWDMGNIDATLETNEEEEDPTVVGRPRWEEER